MPLQEVPAIQLKLGDVVQVEDWPAPTTVKGVKVILHMDNNMDLVVEDQEMLRVIK